MDFLDRIRLTFKNSDPVQIDRINQHRCTLLPELFYRIGIGRGDNKEAAKVVLEILVLHGGKALQVQLHPHVEPGREAGRIQRVSLKVLCDHVGGGAVLLAHPVQQ